MSDLVQHPTVPLKLALASFEAALAVVPMTDVTRDGALRRFKFALDLSWKTIAKALSALGRDVASRSPKPVFRDAFEEGFIDDLQVWFDYLQARNLLGHTYHERQADVLFEKVRTFPPICRCLIERLDDVDDA